MESRIELVRADGEERCRLPADLTAVFETAAAVSASEHLTAGDEDV
jgi:hypothetical protein